MTAVAGRPTLAVEVRGLSVTLDGARILDAVDAAVAPGEWLALIGPNGAGKTTLLRAIAGSVSAAGAIALLGHDLAALGRRERARAVSVVPQLPETPPALTVAEYVLLGRTPHIAPLGRERRADRLAATRAIARLDLTAFVERPLHSLSGGERQRVVLARALAQEAPILLLDEPTSALDLGRQQEAFELLDELRVSERLAVVSAMHDLSLAAQYADRLALMDGGRVVAHGPPHEVLTEARLAGSYRAELRILRDEDGAVFVLPRRPVARVTGAGR